MNRKANDILFLPVKSNWETDWIEKMVYVQCFYKFMKGELKKLPSEKSISMLATYIRFGDGKDFKKGKDAYQTLARTDDKEVNSANRHLRLLGLLKKGEFKESDNEFCLELKLLRQYYLFLTSKGDGDFREAKFHFKMLLDDGHKG